MLAGEILLSLLQKLLEHRQQSVGAILGHCLNKCWRGWKHATGTSADIDAAAKHQYTDCFQSDKQMNAQHSAL